LEELRIINLNEIKKTQTAALEVLSKHGRARFKAGNRTARRTGDGRLIQPET
jgi:hypothetical protein